MTALNAEPLLPSGPFAEGVPPEALEVTYPPIERFGVSELRRALLVAAVVVAELARSLPSLVRRRRRPAEGLAEAIVDAFERSGPTFVKLGQLIASSPGIFPPTLATSCRRTLDRVAPVGVDYIRRTIAVDLGIDPDEAFADFDPVPLSAASVAQVHACTLHDGRPAVVKVQRPGVLAEGRRADLNVIDFDNLHIREPEVRWDLPTGAGRILQPSTGYLATLVAGQVVRRHDADTGVRPGRLVRSGKGTR